ncbi:uncharacterized protein LOC119374196 isoform X2 [Rhipicephalus sanguineus]|uniref:uncharacterized protein LOC119374196 isoform X2 n=1 Tax=Rhipicephalus sanguineus TaxID=34632 RepID=UPI0020C240B2|nr:uncharacterized protein LOC119374196 isoform X2 [Rhipicephalus sanguineus]
MQRRSSHAMALVIVGVAAGFISVASADAPLQLDGSVRTDELGQRCRNDRHCFEHSIRHVICVDSRCVCQDGYKPAVVDDWVECKLETLIGDSCSSAKPCSRYSRAVCLNGTCMCKDDTYFADDHCEKFTSFEKQGGESFHTTSKFNVLAILMIVAILVVALLFLVNQRKFALVLNRVVWKIAQSVTRYLCHQSHYHTPAVGFILHRPWRPPNGRHK